MSDTMTVKELAEVANVTPKTIYRAIKKLHYDIKRGVEAKFDHEQCLRIVGVVTAGQKNGHLSKAHRTPVHSSPSQNGKVQRQNVAPEIIKAFSEALQVMNKLAAECAESNAMTRRLVETMSSRQVIAPPEQEYSTISGYCRRNGIRVDLETAKRFGKIATAISNERGYPIRKLSDERWGEVNAYHVSVLSQAVSA